MGECAPIRPKGELGHTIMTFGFVECGSLAAWIVFVFMRMGPSYEQKSGKSMWKHMAWRLLRLIMGALLVVSIYYFTHDGATADSWQIIVGFTLFVVHVVLVKMCYMMRNSSAGMLGVYSAFVIATAGVMFVPMCVDPPGSLWPVNVACFAVYTALLVAKMAYKVYRRYNLKPTNADIRRSLMQKNREF